MKTKTHRVDPYDPNHGIIVVEMNGVFFTIHVFRNYAGVLFFTFRHPDPSQSRRAAPVLNRLNELIPFDVADLLIAT